MNARPNVPDYEHKANQELRDSLTKQGFAFEITSQGYFVRFNGKGLGGATTASRPHGRYREANIRDNLQAALRLSMNHKTA